MPTARRPVATILPFVGTVDVAAIWSGCASPWAMPRLTFMGQSYGTLIGETYAAMYPTHVRAMVLDSAIDPALPIDHVHVGSGRGL